MNFFKLGDIDQDYTFYETIEIDTQRSFHSSGRDPEEEENDLPPPNNLNMHDLELSRSMILDSSGSVKIKLSGSILNYNEYMRHVYQDSELQKS